MTTITLSYWENLTKPRTRRAPVARVLVREDSVVIESLDPPDWLLHPFCREVVLFAPALVRLAWREWSELEQPRLAFADYLQSWFGTGQGAGNLHISDVKEEP